MNGQDLYNLYAEITLEIENCEVDSWDDLSDDNQQTWNRLAQKVCP